MRAKNKGGLPAASVVIFVSGLSGLDVLRLPAFWPLYDIELDLLAFLQAAKAV